APPVDSGSHPTPLSRTCLRLRRAAGTCYTPPNFATGEDVQMEELPEAFREPASVGGFDGVWLTEFFERAERHSIRTTERLHDEASPWQRIAVYDTGFFGRVLTLDGLIMVTERDEFVYHEMLAHVPLCSLADPRSVLIIGGGDCGTLREVLKHPDVTRV